MITIEYCEKGKCISDFNYQKYIDLINYKISLKEDLILKISTSILITAIRYNIIKGLIDCKNIEFKFNKEQFQLNKFGGISEWPKGFADIEHILNEKIMIEILKKGKDI